MSSKISAEHLERGAVVYVRQSSMLQVQHNLESQRRQYGLAERARELGFREVQVIDEDLGRSGSGSVERPGFQRLAAAVCAGEVGAVFCLEASRLARNGRDWYHLIELCALARVVLVDADGIYDPCVVNDRLLLGLKGTMSEFELNLFRQRSREAIKQKAARGELEFQLPAGLCWTEGGGIELDPDHGIQQALRLVFSKMEELGSVRQVYLWFRQQGQRVPVRMREGQTVWKVPGYSTVNNVLSNPFHAGAYVFGRRQMRTRVVDGRARKTMGPRRRQRDWAVLIREHHPGYITWERYERNQEMIEANAHMKSRMRPKAGRGGRGLLAGLLRCRRCGRMLQVGYTGASGAVLRYLCKGGPIGEEGRKCISFGGLKADEVVSEKLLEAVAGNAVEAALEAAEEERARRGEERRAVELALEQARYEARLSGRRYEAVDPEKRLVAAELEERWNTALERVRELERRVEEVSRRIEAADFPSRELLLDLARDLPAVWNDGAADMRLKQRIARLALREIVADVDEESREVVLVLHWAGGRHTEVRWEKSRRGVHTRANLEAVEIIRKMAGQCSDEEIALTLNRLQLKTGTEGYSWSGWRVAYTRGNHGMASYRRELGEGKMSLLQAAKRLGVSATAVRGLIGKGLLAARQIVPCGPWEIAEAALESEGVAAAVRVIQRRGKIGTRRGADQPSLFSES